MKPRIGTKPGDRIFEGIIVAVLAVVGISMLYPFLYVLAVSLNDPADTELGGIWLYIFSLNGVLSRQPRWGSPGGRAGGGGAHAASDQPEIWPDHRQTSKDATFGLAGNQL